MKKINFKDYPIFKKRDGQQWEKVSSIYANGFVEAKKQFAKMMTDDNYSKSNDIVWLTKENDGVETGFYDLNASIVVSNEETGEADYTHKDTILEVFCLESSIKKGFAHWNEDVYSYELRKK